MKEPGTRPLWLTADEWQLIFDSVEGVDPDTSEGQEMRYRVLYAVGRLLAEWPETKGASVWKVYVKVESDPKWYTNGMVYPTLADGEDAARSLFARWLLTTDWLVAEFDAGQMIPQSVTDADEELVVVSRRG